MMSVIIRCAQPTDVITTITGTGGNGYSGDGGDATSATLYYPFGVALDSAGTVHMNNRFT